MKKYFLSAAALMIIFFSPQMSAQLIEAQELWTRYYDSGGFTDYTWDMAVDGSGNVYLLGEGLGSGIVTVKYDASGNLQWGRLYENAEPRSIEVDGSGNVYVTGEIDIIESNLVVDRNIVTVKYDASGNKLWDVQYNGGGTYFEFGTDVKVDGSGNVYVGGKANVSGSLLSMVVIKYNSSGTQQWASLYPGLNISTELNVYIALDNSGNVYASGTIGNDIATAKYNSSGQQQWVSTYNDPDDHPDKLSKMKLDGSGNVYVSGYTDPFSSAYDSDLLLLKYNPSTGALIWASVYDGGYQYDDTDPDIEIDGTGNVYLGAVSFTNTSCLAVLKYNSAGSLQWATKFAADYLPTPHTALDANGNLYIVSHDQVNKDTTDIWTYALSSTGLILWSKVYHAKGNTFEFVEADGSGNIIVSSSDYLDFTTSYDLLAIKYQQVHQPVDDAIQDAIADVNSLPLSSGNKNALMSKLQNALAKYESGDLLAAKNLLNAFLNQLYQFISSGYITLAQAQPLINYVNLIIGEINLLLAKSNHDQLPQEFSISRNYPNPFNPSTTIRYEIPYAVKVQITVFNSLGEKVTDLVNEIKEPGSYEVHFNAAELSSGIYFYRITAGDYVNVQKMMLLK